MKKIVTIVGARPQFIKAAPVSRELRKMFQEKIINTGQHYDYKMAGVFFDELQIPKPDYNLGIGSASHGKQTGEMIKSIEEILTLEKPDGVLLYGDTNSTVAGALAAAKMHIPVFHIEAGLRSFNKQMPEEINRILTDHVSSILFSPTNTAVKNLKAENINDNVHLVGDVMYDAVLFNIEIALSKYNLDSFGVKSKEFYLATIHRAENTDNSIRLRAIIESLLSIQFEILVPIHPRTESKLRELNLFEMVKSSKNVKLIQPVSYLEMLMLEMNALGIITDSGGVQKEAYFAKVPCYTLREETEWIETIEIGWNKLVDPLSMDINEILNTKTDSDYIENMYGDGSASKKIVEILINFFEG